MFEYPENIYNTAAAEQVVPYLNELFKPATVLDVGCGKCTWLNIFSKFSNIKKIRGVDGEYVDRAKLLIPDQSFFPLDLNKPFNLNEEYDLVLSLEVAEHLKEDAAESFVESLTRHGKVIVFSAAIPGQGGQDHINEQWPEYWRQKFSKHEYEAYDVLRKIFWNNENVNWWYRQNMFIYAKKGFVSNKLTDPQIHLNSYIHPKLFRGKINQIAYLEQTLQTRTAKLGMKESFISLIRAMKKKLIN